MIYADLHTHTNYSDGTQEVEEVVKLAHSKGIKALAVSDHDTIFHYERVKNACEEYGIEAIRGVEMSCYDFTKFKKIHVVGLWLNDTPVHVEKLCKKTLESRDHYHRKLIHELNEKGLNITYEDAKKYSPYNIVFKMHLFQAIIEKYPQYNNIEKYRSLFASKTTKETDLEMGYIDIKDGIEAIRKDGGVSIIAHPCEYDNYDEIEKYISYGLQGIEISHPSMKVEDYIRTNEIADKYHLLRSGGSDFHDLNLTKMGENGLTKEQFITLKSDVKKIQATYIRDGQ